MQRSRRIVGLLFSEGVSLAEWFEKGLYQRELALYREHFNQGVLDSLWVFTYGEDSSLHVPDDFVKVFSIPRLLNNKFMRRCYPFLMPLIHFGAFKQVEFFKTNQLNGVIPGLIAKVFFRSKLVYRSGYNYVEFLTKGKAFFLRRLYWGIIEVAAVKFSDLVLASSDKDHFRNRYLVSIKFFGDGNCAGKVRQLRNYIDTVKFYPRISGSAGVRFVFVGRIAPQKNLESVLEPFLSNGYGIDVIGNGEKCYVDQLKARFQAPNIKFKGAVDNDSLPELLRQYEFFILGSFYEGTPKALLEAMSCGLVCIGSPASSIEAVLKDAGLIASGFDAGSLARTIEKAWSLSSHEKREMSVKARRIIMKRFTLSIICRQEQSYFELISRSDDSYVEPVAVLMAVHNGEQFLRASVESVLNQSYPCVKLYVVDDGSNDSTAQILADYSEITVIKNQTSIGLAASLNKGLMAINEKLIARMDADDIACNSRIEEQVRDLRRTKCDVVSSRAEYIDENDVTIGASRALAKNDRSVKEYLLFGNPIIHPSVLFYSSLKIRYDENFDAAQDYELWCRIQDSVTFYINPKRLIKYRKHNSSITSSKSLRQKKLANAIKTKFVKRMACSGNGLLRGLAADVLALVDSNIINKLYYIIARSGQKMLLLRRIRGL